MYSSTLSSTSALDKGEYLNHAPHFSLQGKRLGTHSKEAEWAPGPVWTRTNNLAPIGIRSLYLPARSESLHRLRARGPKSRNFIGFKIRKPKMAPYICKFPYSNLGPGTYFEDPSFWKRGNFIARPYTLDEYCLPSACVPSYLVKWHED